MTKLPKYEVRYDKNKENWGLFAEGSARAKARTETKAEMVKGGNLPNLLGDKGGSVRIKLKESQTIQEERTFPRSADPKKSPG